MVSFLLSLLYFGRSAASGLPCAGAAPPQRPPTKPSLTDRVHSSQPVGWRAWRRLYTSRVTKSLNGPKNDWLVNCCGLVVTAECVTRDIQIHYLFRRDCDCALQ